MGTVYHPVSMLGAIDSHVKDMGWVVSCSCSLSPTQVTNDMKIICHLLCWASGGGAGNSPLHVLNMGISYSCWHPDGTINCTQSLPNSLRMYFKEARFQDKGMKHHTPYVVLT